jgi:thioredoxin reductase
MFDWDVIVVGGGPAGLTAGLYLSRAGQRVIVLEKADLGGQIKNIGRIENTRFFNVQAPARPEPPGEKHG